MITFSLWSALIVYYFVMFATPGPNNAMLTASGMKFGFLRTLPHILGIPLGHFIQITLVCYGLGTVFVKFPQIQFYMKFLCFLYLIYLSWKMLGSISVVNKESGRPLKFYEASLFQFLNPKAWIVAITAASVFFPKEESFLTGIIFVAGIAPIVCLPSISIWALFGSSIRLFISHTRVKKWIEIILAILLVATGITILL